MTGRRPFIAGNWKMFLVRETAIQLARGLAERIGRVAKVDVAIFPPFPYLMTVRDAIAGSSIKLGAQDVYHEKSGAFTGEVSPEMLADCGCTHVLIGHSERRRVIGETDELINRKLKAALEFNLNPVLCIGEILEEREANKTFAVVDQQLKRGLSGVRPEQMRNVTIAYEPVWAIGTGKVATPQQAEEVHAHIRSTLTTICGNDLAQSQRIQYGGSVNSGNAKGLLSMPNVDGALVGGACLKVDEFTQIINTGVEVLGA